MEASWNAHLAEATIFVTEEWRFSSAWKIATQGFTSPFLMVQLPWIQTFWAIQAADVMAYAFTSSANNAQQHWNSPLLSIRAIRGSISERHRESGKDRALFISRFIRLSSLEWRHDLFRPSPLLRGMEKVWAAAAVHTVGRINFLNDPS